MEPVAIVGIITAGVTLNTLMNKATKQNNIETCVNAYYADKYNTVKFGHPGRTLFKCMKAHYPETFKEVKAKYKPVENFSSTSEPSNSSS